MLLKDQLTTLANRKEEGERIKHPANYNMASADAIAFDKAEYEEKKQKLDEQATKNLESKKKIFCVSKRRKRKKRNEKKLLNASQPSKTRKIKFCEI